MRCIEPPLPRIKPLSRPINSPSTCSTGRPARERVRVTAIGAEAQILRLHRRGEAGRDRLLPEREMAGALDEILQEQVEGALLGLADHDLQAVELEPLVLADVIVETRLRGLRLVQHEVPRQGLEKWLDLRLS